MAMSLMTASCQSRSSIRAPPLSFRSETAPDGKRGADIAADIGLDLGLIFRLQGYCDALFPAGEGGFGAGRGRGRSHFNEPMAKGGAGTGLKAVKEATHRGNVACICNNADMPRETIGIKDIFYVKAHLDTQHRIYADVSVEPVDKFYKLPFPLIYHFSMALRRK